MEVWIMEHATAGRRTWSPLYNILMQKPLDILMLQHQLTLPNFTTHDNEYILTVRYDCDLHRHAFELYKHKPSNDVKKAWRGVVEISERNRGAEVAVIPSDYIRPRTFAYTETTGIWPTAPLQPVSSPVTILGDQPREEQVTISRKKGFHSPPLVPKLFGPRLKGALVPV
jgi:hypothetical protein